MIRIVLVLAAAALMSQQCGFEADAQIIENSNNNIDNNLLPNVVPTPKKQRRFRKHVSILTRPDEEIRRGVGDRLELECVVSGNPFPIVRWEKNGKTVFDVEEMNEILPSFPTGMGRVTSKLVITSTTPGEDQYTCFATAGAYSDAATSTVITLPSADAEEDLQSLEKLYQPTKPTITYFYINILKDIGSMLVLPCRVHSMTKSQVYWYDAYDQAVRNNPRMRVLPSGDLVINELRFSDLGGYTCNVKNAYGKDTMTTFVYPVQGSTA